MEFPDFLAGYVRIQVSGDACERFFNLCAYHRLKLWRLLPEAEAYTACISVRDFRKLKTLVKKSHVRLRITERHGLPFFIRKYRRRRLWVLGFLAAVWLLLWLGAHVWRITLNGNVRQTSPPAKESPPPRYDLDSHHYCHCWLHHPSVEAKKGKVKLV